MRLRRREAELMVLPNCRNSTNATPWPRYLARYHDTRPGITELLLAQATDRRRERPYSWLVEPLLSEREVILDLACGSAPTCDLLPDQRWLGVDLSAGELALAMAAGRGPVVRGSADRLPVGDNAVGAVCAAMCLQVLSPLDEVLAEVMRVLRPGGRLVALVPSRMWFGRGLPGWWRVMHALGIRSQPWPNPEARDGLPKILRAHGFNVDADERRVFRHEIGDPGAAALLVEGLYLPGTAPERIEAAQVALAAWARPGRRLPFPLRRVVAHLPVVGCERPEVLPAGTS